MKTSPISLRMSWDLQGADLNGTDLRHAVLRGTNLQGADLSTAQLHGPELRGTILHRGQLKEAVGKQADCNNSQEKAPPQAQRTPLRELEQKGLSDQEAFLIGERVWLTDVDLISIRQLFPHGFTFARARQVFDTWLAQTRTRGTEREIQAIGLGFASRLCRLYHEETPEA